MQLGAERGARRGVQSKLGPLVAFQAGLRRLPPLSLGDFPDLMFGSGLGQRKDQAGRAAAVQKTRNSERPDWHESITVKSRSITFAAEFLMYLMTGTARMTKAHSCADRSVLRDQALWTDMPVR